MAEDLHLKHPQCDPVLHVSILTTTPHIKLDLRHMSVMLANIIAVLFCIDGGVGGALGQGCSVLPPFDIQHRLQLSVLLRLGWRSQNWLNLKITTCLTL